MQIQFHLSSAFLQSLLDERTRRQLVRCYEPFQALNLELLVDRPRLAASTIGVAQGDQTFPVSGADVVLQGAQVRYRPTIQMNLLQIMRVDGQVTGLEFYDELTLALDLSITASMEGPVSQLCQSLVEQTVTLTHNPALEGFASAWIDDNKQKFLGATCIPLDLSDLTQPPGGASAGACKPAAYEIAAVGLAPAENNSVVLRLVIGPPSASTVVSWQAFFQGTVPSILQEDEEWALLFDGNLIASAVRQMAVCNINQEMLKKGGDEKIILNSSSSSWDYYPFEDPSGYFKTNARVDLDATAVNLDCGVDIDLDITIRNEFSYAQGGLRLTSKISVDKSDWDSFKCALGGFVAGMHWAMSLDPPLNGLLWLPGAVAGPVVAAFVLAFHKEAIKEFTPQCTKLDDDGYVQECIFPIQLPASGLGLMSLSDVRSLEGGLVFAGNASSKQAVIPPFSLPDQVDLHYHLPCGGALIANKILKLPIYSSAAGAVAVGICTLEKNDPDGHYLVGKRLFNELEIRFLKHPSELAGPPGPCTILIITALGAELIRVNPPMNGSPQDLASMEQENKLTCHFQETVSEANWLEKKLKFQPDPRLMFDDPVLDASLINVVLGNLVTGETLTMLDAQGNQLFEAAPGPRGFAQLRLPVELLERGFELNLKTTSAGDDVRARSARKTPGPFSMTLHGLVKSLSISLVGGLIQAIPDEAAGQRLLHLVAGQEVVTLQMPADEPVRLQAQVRPGIVNGAHLLAPGLLLVGGESGLLLVQPTQGHVAVVDALVEPVLGLVTLEDVVLALTEDAVLQLDVSLRGRRGFADAARAIRIRRSHALDVRAPRQIVTSGRFAGILSDEAVTVVTLAGQQLVQQGRLSMPGIERIHNIADYDADGRIYVQAERTGFLLDLAQIGSSQAGESRRVPLRQIAEPPNIIRRLRLGTRLLEVAEDGQVMLLRRAGVTDLIPFVAAQLARG